VNAVLIYCWMPPIACSSKHGAVACCTRAPFAPSSLLQHVRNLLIPSSINHACFLASPRFARLVASTVRSPQGQPGPWMVVLGCFDDTTERNMWLPAVTTNATSEDFVFRGLDGVCDHGSADPSDGSWTIFYDLVSAFFAQGELPAGRVATLVSRAPLSVAAYRTLMAAGDDGTMAPVTMTAYANPPWPFNRDFPSTNAVLPLPSSRVHTYTYRIIGSGCACARLLVCAAWLCACSKDRCGASVGGVLAHAVFAAAPSTLLLLQCLPVAKHRDTRPS
jgi:hypothetical protein